MFPRITHLEKKSKENKFKIAHYLLFVWKKTDVDIGKEGMLKPTKLCLNILITDLPILFITPSQGSSYFFNTGENFPHLFCVIVESLAT